MAHVEAIQLPQPPRLPLSASDGDRIIDKFGNVYEFNTETKTWINLGRIDDPDVVTLTNDGLVSPEIFDRLICLSKLIEAGASFEPFKLVVGNLNPYFYYFKSSDKLIKFDAHYDKIRPNCVDRETRLCIEIDKAAILRRLLRVCCVGPVGDKGLKGDTGRNGIAASSELIRVPTSTTKNSITISATVSTPIDTEISIRIFDDSDQVAELFLSLDGVLSIVESDYDIELSNTEIIYEPTSEKLSGTISFAGLPDNIESWTYKARQRGPAGFPGADGSNFLQVEEQIISDPALRSSQAIVSIRKSNLTSDIFPLKTNMFEKICGGNLAAVQGLQGVNTQSVFDIDFAAAKVTIDECKTIGYFELPAIPEVTAPSAASTIIPEIDTALDLPNWTPTSACIDHNRFGLLKFNWYDFTDPRYPFRIMIDGRPPTQCCQEDFFFCPNIGNHPCPVEGELEAPELSVDLIDDCSLECDIEFELQNGGLEFPILPGVGSVSEECVIRGTVDVYIQKIIIDRPLGIRFTSTPTDGDVASCPYRVTLQIEIISGGVTVSPSTLFSMTAGEEITATFEGSGIIQVTISVNTDRLACCKQYGIELQVLDADEIEPVSTTATTATTGSEPSAPPISAPPGSDPVTPPVSDGGDPPLTEGFFLADSPSISTVEGAAFDESDTIPFGIDVPSKENLSDNQYMFSGKSIIEVNAYTTEVIVNISNSTINHAFPLDPLDLIDDNAIVSIDRNTLRFNKLNATLEDGPFGLGFYLPQTGVVETSLNMIEPSLSMRADRFSAGFLFVKEDGSQLKVFCPLATAIPTADPLGSKTLDALNNMILTAGDGWLRIDAEGEGLDRSIGSRQLFDVQTKGTISTFYAPDGLDIGIIPIPDPEEEQPTEAELSASSEMSISTTVGIIGGNSIQITNIGGVSTVIGSITSASAIDTTLSLTNASEIVGATISPGETIKLFYSWSPADATDVSGEITLFNGDGVAIISFNIVLKAIDGGDDG